MVKSVSKINLLCIYLLLFRVDCIKDEKSNRLCLDDTHKLEYTSYEELNIEQNDCTTNPKTSSRGKSHLH